MNFLVHLCSFLSTVHHPLLHYSPSNPLAPLTTPPPLTSEPPHPPLTSAPHHSPLTPFSTTPFLHHCSPFYTALAHPPLTSAPSPPSLLTSVNTHPLILHHSFTSAYLCPLQPLFHQCLALYPAFTNAHLYPHTPYPPSFTSTSPYPPSTNTHFCTHLSIPLLQLLTSPSRLHYYTPSLHPFPPLCSGHLL